jgi:hypothetical protein
MKSQKIKLPLICTFCIFFIILLPCSDIKSQMFGGQIIRKKVKRIQIPASITIAQNQRYFIASAYDVNYLPYSAPVVAATSSSLNPDATNEPTVINVQGTISTSGITIQIPVTVTASATLPAFTQSISIPDSLTEDNIGRDVMLSWNTQSLTTSSKFITATIVSMGGTLNAKKLDINAGIGADYLGVLLGQFIYPFNSAGATTSYQLRIMPGIPDKMFGVADNTGSTTTHNMLYLPIQAEDGKIWLNNNLGAHYSNINHPNFNLVQQATSTLDFRAYGSLFQYGRKPDGHELVNYTSATSGTALNGTTATRSDNPTNALFITNRNFPDYDWRINPNNTLWNSVVSPNNPCPYGFRVPTISEVNAHIAAANITNLPTAYNSILKFPAAGNREREYGNVEVGTRNLSYNWSSINSYFYAITIIGNSTLDYKAQGFAVRCIKD